MRAQRSYWIVGEQRPSGGRDESGPYSTGEKAEAGLLLLNQAGKMARIVTYLTKDCERCGEPWSIEACTYNQHGCGEIWDNR